MRTKKVFWMTAALGAFLALLTGCPDDKEYLAEAAEVTGPVVSIVVNSAGNGFENKGSKSGYAATANGGSFEKAGGLNVFNTGGTKAGTQSEIPWWPGNYWDNYQNIGYVDLGTDLGNLLISLPSWTIETYVCLPSDAQTDRVGQYVWAFTDKETPDNQVGFNIREFTFRIKQATVDEDVSMGWDGADPLKGNGSWHHIVVTKNGGSTGAVYWDGTQVVSGPSTKLMSGFAEGTFVHNTLGGTVYPNDVYDQQLFNTKYYSFNVYDYALDSDQVMYNYLDGTLDTLKK